MATVGVFYRVFHSPSQAGASRVLNFAIPDTEDIEAYPIVEVARLKIDRLHPNAKFFTIIALAREEIILEEA